MTGITILSLLIVYLKVHEYLLNLFRLKSSIGNLITYASLGFLIAGILLYFNYDKTTKGSLIILVFYALILLIQIGYWYFKSPGKLKASQ